MDKISLIIPCYNEEQALPFLYKEIVKLAEDMRGQEFEFIFINDGSKDRTLELIKELRESDDRVHYVSFSRNFGKEAGIYAGLKTATGNYISLIDADLQDPPSLIKEMYESLKTEDYDCVATRRVDRKGEPVVRSFFAKQFYKLINKISDTEVVDGARDFRLMTRQMVDAILEMGEYNRFSKGIFGWVGFKTKWIAFENVERVAGQTKWSFIGLFFYVKEIDTDLLFFIELFHCLRQIRQMNIKFRAGFYLFDKIRFVCDWKCFFSFRKLPQTVVLRHNMQPG